GGRSLGDAAARPWRAGPRRARTRGRGSGSPRRAVRRRPDARTSRRRARSPASHPHLHLALERRPLVNKLLALSLLAACSSGEPPSPNPPGPWGVPISGGNMIIAHDGQHAIIADADRDRVMSVDVRTGSTKELALDKNAEPGRLAEDAAGRIHIALR